MSSTQYTDIDSLADIFSSCDITEKILASLNKKDPPQPKNEELNIHNVPADEEDTIISNLSEMSLNDLMKECASIIDETDILTQDDSDILSGLEEPEISLIEEQPKVLRYERLTPETMSHYHRHRNSTQDLFNRLHQDFYDRIERRNLLRTQFYNDLMAKNTFEINDLSKQLSAEIDNEITTKILQEREQMLMINKHLVANTKL